MKIKKFEDWTKLYSEKFREIIDVELDANENFWEDFKNSEFREALMKKIEGILYADDGAQEGKNQQDNEVDKGDLEMAA